MSSTPDPDPDSIIDALIALLAEDPDLPTRSTGTWRRRLAPFREWLTRRLRQE
jgi:hypothetical protein